jgi:sugar lactone lactonase YvrE
MFKALFACSLLLFLCVFADATGPSVWSVDSRAEVMRGDARGVSIDDNGTITLAPQFTELMKTDQPYIWSSVADAAGNVYLGTGSDGKIFRVDRTGRGALFADLAELNVSALSIGRSGELFAATSPDGKVYRIDTSGKSEIYFDPKQKYIWSLAVMADGSLAVGTGENGRIYQVRNAGADADSSLLFDSSETHIISLAVDKSGNLYAGTDPGGFVLRFGAERKPFAVLDSSLREVHDIDIAADGTVYALALGESVAAAKPTETPSTTTTATPAKTAAPASEPPPKSRYDLQNTRSAVYRLLPDGGSDLIWASATVSGFSISAARPGAVLVGTSDKGRIYSVTDDGRETLALQSDASQISTMITAAGQIFATSSNQGNLYRIGGDLNSEGTYESSVLDAKAAATWGRIWWRSSGNIQLETRSGNTEKPNETWSVWTAVGTNAQVASPKARYLQWRAVLRSGATPATLNDVNVAYQPRNIAPEVLAVQTLPTNVGLASNPAPLIDPNIAASGLEPGLFGIASTNVPPRRVYQRGATSLVWMAEDRNGDKLVYDILYREVNETNFRPLKENVEENFLTIDGQTLADGRYIFKVVAKDSPSNPAELALTGERSTTPIDIDNTPPTVAVQDQPRSSGNTAQITFSASDKASYLTKAEYSLNSGEWQTVYADDGISDSPNETYTIKLPAPTGAEQTITIRVFDVNGNAGNARAVVRR